MLKYLLLLFILISCSETTITKETKEQFNEKDFNKSILKLEEHITERLKVKNRAEWENPYIYYLDIGDLYLKKGNIKKATEYYLLADTKEVNKAYVNHRLRNIADFYMAEKEYNAAINHLNKYKYRDELLFGLMLDRLAREIVNSDETP